jgi:hypothetical protein
VPTALVTGSPERVPDIATALKSEGFDVLAAGSEPPPALGELIDCYVQLPSAVMPEADSALGRARAVIADELARFDAAALLAPRLSPRATVVLVADAEGQPRPDARALHRLVGLLAEAIHRDHAGVRATVVDARQSPSEIAALARGRAAAAGRWAGYSEHAPELPFADWRADIFCLTAD